MAHSLDVHVFFLVLRLIRNSLCSSFLPSVNLILCFLCSLVLFLHSFKIYFLLSRPLFLCPCKTLSITHHVHFVYLSSLRYSAATDYSSDRHLICSDASCDKYIVIIAARVSPEGGHKSSSITLSLILPASDTNAWSITNPPFIT